MSGDLARRQASMFSRSVIGQSDSKLSLKMPLQAKFAHSSPKTAAAVALKRHRR